jgi:hypothetical protein
MSMLRVAPIALLLGATALRAQTWKESMVRLGPQSYSYKIKTPVNETVSELAFPLFVRVPVLPALTVDVGTAYATARYERRINDSTTTTSQMNGLTDTQLRANYAFGQDFVVVTAGLNLPTGSATIAATDLDAATRIGSDFLAFPVSGFGSGFGMTGGVAIARPAGEWNLGLATSLRNSSEYEPFKQPNDSVVKFDPGMEVRTRVSVDHPFGTGRIAFGVTYSKVGDDKANSATFNTGNRILGQVVVNSSLKNGTDYTLVLWNLYRSSGTLMNAGESPSGNITNALMSFGIRGPADVGIEPSVEAKVFTQQNERTSFLANMGLRFYINRGTWAAVPGFGFSFGQMAAGSSSATVTGMRTTLAVRVGM